MTSPNFGLPSASAQVEEVVVGCDPTDVKAAPAGDRIIVVDASGIRVDEPSLGWIDTATLRLIAEVSLGFGTGEVVTGVAFAPDAAEGYVLRRRQDGSHGVLTAVPMSRLAPQQ